MAVEKLQNDVDDSLEEIEYFQQNIPPGGPEEEDALSDFERRIKELKRKRKQKLDDIGYESPEDSDADQSENDHVED